MAEDVVADVARQAPSGARSFEGLRVFQEARVLVRRVYELTREGPISRDYGLVDQMRRSAVSILPNIAEGFERQTRAEFIRALYIAKGSCGELRAQGLVALDQDHWSKASYEGIAGRCRKISAGIFHLIVHLRKTSAPRKKKA